MSPAPNSAEPLFSTRAPEPAAVNFVPWVIAGVVILAVVAVLVFAGHKKPGLAANTPLPPDPYADFLSVTAPQMSESTSLSGGKSMYIDGHIKNGGSRTITGITVQVYFANDEAMPPQIETVPLSLVRTHEPYIDTQPISAAPLAPGDDREFRLIFEGVRSNWNQQLPQMRAVQVITR